MESSASRGQFVLLAAAVLAVAIVPMTLAYLQLGYHEDVDAAGSETPLRDAEGVLDRALHGAIDGIPEAYPWANRTAAVTEVRERFHDDITTLNRSGIETGTVYAITYNHSRAVVVADEACASGPGREFGSCRADRGIVVQNRANRTHVLAATFDLRVTRPDGTWRATTVVRVTRR